MSGQIADLEEELAACRQELHSLRESERKYRHLFEHSPVMVYLSNLDGAILDINEAGVRLLGYQSREEIVGKLNARSLYTDQRNRLRFVETIAAHGSVEAFETQMRRKDGSIIDVRITSSVRLNDRGEIEGYEGFIADITDKKATEEALKESEEKHRSLLENSLAAVFVHQNGIMRYINQRGAEMLAYETPAEIIGRHFWELIHPEDRALVKRRGLRRQKTDFHPNQYIMRCIKKNGDTLWTDMRAARTNYLGEPAVIGNFIDITKSKEAEEKIHHLSRRLIEAIEEEGRRLAADLHDEFGQTLTSLHMSLESMEACLAGNADLRERCRTLIRRVELLADQVRKTTARLRPDMLDHLGLIPTIEWHIQDFLSQREDMDVEFQVMGFKRRLRGPVEIVLYRVFQECLTNITKHARASKVEVILTYSHPSVIMVIRDNGVGFTAAEEGMPPGRPRGIGLLSMRERVASLGGSFDISSMPGRGTTIRVEVPEEGIEG